MKAKIPIQSANIIFNEWFLSLPDDYSLFDLLYPKTSSVRPLNSLYRAGVEDKKDLELLFRNNDKKTIIKTIKKFGEKSYDEVVKIIT